MPPCKVSDSPPPPRPQRRRPPPDGGQWRRDSSVTLRGLVVALGVGINEITDDHRVFHGFHEGDQFVGAAVCPVQIQLPVLFRRKHGVLQQCRGAVHQERAVPVRDFQAGQHVFAAFDGLEVQPVPVGNVPPDPRQVFVVRRNHRRHIVPFPFPGQLHCKRLCQSGFSVFRAAGNENRHAFPSTVNWSP